MAGQLTLIPTPIDEVSPLEPVAKERLLNAVEEGNSLFVIEDLKPGRRRWLRFGLPRSVVEDFVLFNEHTSKEKCEELIAELKKGKNVFLMSDGGLPAFCDPGRNLVQRCHQLGIKVTATPFSNSISLAIALCGFNHDRFIFEGFLPIKDPQRKEAYQRISKNHMTTVVMDTPYRLKKMIAEVAEIMPDRKCFVGMNLNQEDEKLVVKKASALAKMTWPKAEFILILS